MFVHILEHIQTVQRRLKRAPQIDLTRLGGAAVRTVAGRARLREYVVDDGRACVLLRHPPESCLELLHRGRVGQHGQSPDRTRVDDVEFTRVGGRSNEDHRRVRLSIEVLELDDAVRSLVGLTGI